MILFFPGQLFEMQLFTESSREAINHKLVHVKDAVNGCKVNIFSLVQTIFL